MLKKPIKYTNFNEEEVTEVYYFNLSKVELMEMELFGKGGSFSGWMETVVEASDNQTLFTEFKKLILASYGEKADDGKRFIKSDELRNAFSQTAAFDALFMDLATNTDSAIQFIKGVVPADMVIDEDVAKAQIAKLEGTQPSVPQPPSPPAVS